MGKIREGYKETEIGVIPEDWEVFRICDVANFISNGFVGTASPFYSDDESSTLYLMGNNVRENYIDKRTLVRINNEFTEKYPKSKVFKGDMLTVQSGHIGTSCIVTKEFDNAHCHAVIITRFDKAKINPDYQAYYLNSSEGKNRLKSLFVGTTIKHINTKDLKVFQIPLPPLPEQQRIAEIFSTTDEHIEKLDKTIEDYQLLKKSMMRKLLTEGIGHTEFKETEIGRIPKEWEVVNLSRIADVKGGKRLPKGYSLNDSDTGFPYLRVSDMFQGGINKSEIKYVPVEVEPVIKSYKISKDDLFISVAGTLGIIGSVPEELDNANLTENANKICKIKCHKTYLMYYLQSPFIQNVISNEKTVGAQPKLALKRIQAFLIGQPKLKEQQHIAEILSELDNKIELYIQEKQDYIQLKKTLMEKLLTGKIRTI